MKLVTMLMDVNRDAFPSHSRTIDDYLDAFAAGIGQLNCTIVLFHDKTLTNRLLAGLGQRSIRANVEFFELSMDELPFAETGELLEEVLAGPAMRFFALRDSLFSATTSVHQILRILINRFLKRSRQIWDELPVTTAKAPEYTSAPYLRVTWSKAWTLLKVWELGIEDRNEPLVFADFGLGHGLEEFSKTVKGKQLDSKNLEPERVNLTMRREQIKVTSPWHLAQELDDAVVPAGVFGGYLEPIKKFHEFLQAQVPQNLAMGLAPDDQVMLALYASTHDSDVHFMPKSDKFDGWYQLAFFLKKSSE